MICNILIHHRLHHMYLLRKQL